MAELKIYAKPSSLYRYRPLGSKADRELEALEQGYIYCPAYSVMNDPMEGLYRLSDRLSQSATGEKSQARVNEALRQMGIASMSEVYDHEPMWAHYADQFAGMCVRYSLNRLIKGLSADVAITRMLYSEREPVLLKDNSKAIDRARLCLSSKTVRWSSEREWRLFQTEQGAANYTNLNTVTKIFIGSRASDADEAKVRRVGKLLRVPVVRMQVESYSIAFKSIPRLMKIAADKS